MLKTAHNTDKHKEEHEDKARVFDALQEKNVSFVQFRQAFSRLVKNQVLKKNHFKIVLHDLTRYGGSRVKWKLLRQVMLRGTDVELLLDEIMLEKDECLEKQCCIKEKKQYRQKWLITTGNMICTNEMPQNIGCEMEDRDMHGGEIEWAPYIQAWSTSIALEEANNCIKDIAERQNLMEEN